MALKPRVVKIEEQKPRIATTESQTTDSSVKPSIVKTEEIKPDKPTAEK